MIAPELLFRMLPDDAVRAMLGEKLRTPLKATHLRLGKPQSLGGVKTGVVVTLDKTRAPVELWDLDGSYSFEYDRVELGEFTSGIDRSIDTTLPADTVDMLGAVLSPFNIPVVEGDLVPAIYLALGTVDVLADEHSYRWIGGCDVTLTMKAIEIDTLLLVKHFIIPFNVEYRSNSIKARLALYINLANASALKPQLTTAMFTLGEPVTNAPIGYQDNTAIALTFNGSPYTGSVVVTYQRRAFEITYRRPVEISGGQWVNKQQLSTQLSAQMGCDIQTADLLSEEFPPLAIGQELSFPVQFSPSSLAYIGSVLVKYRRIS